MTKGELVDSTHSSINGNRPNTDMAITKSFIRTFVPAAVNFVLTGDYWANMNQEGDKEVPGTFVSELGAKSISIDDREREYIDIDVKVAMFNGNAAIRSVEDCLGNRYSPRSQAISTTDYWDNVLPSLLEYKVVGKRMYLYNKPELVDFIFPSVVQDASELSDSDELPIPAGKEAEAIGILRRLCMDPAMVQKDYIINGVDPQKDKING